MNKSIFKEYNIGDCFGRFDINLEDPRRDTTAVAEENCYLLVVEKETIKKYLKVSKSKNFLLYKIRQQKH